MKSGLAPLLVLFATVIARPALANSDIYEGINHLRLNRCATDVSKRLPLAPTAELENAARRRAGGESISDALADSPTQFSSASVLVVGGDIKTALSRLGDRHCDKLADTGLTHVGAVFAKNRWWVVLGSKENESTESVEMAASPVVASADIADALLNRINAARSQDRSCGAQHLLAVPPIALSRHLTEAATLHAHDMVQRRYFAHTSPESQSVGDRVRNTGYRFRAIGENIAAVPADNPALVVEGWLKSPGHCANIMSSQFSEMGAAVARLPGSQQGKWVLVLGSRQ